MVIKKTTDEFLVRDVSDFAICEKLFFRKFIKSLFFFFFFLSLNFFCIVCWRNFNSEIYARSLNTRNQLSLVTPLIIFRSLLLWLCKTVSSFSAAFIFAGNDLDRLQYFSRIVLFLHNWGHKQKRKLEKMNLYPKLR